MVACIRVTVTNVLSPLQPGMRKLSLCTTKRSKVLDFIRPVMHELRGYYLDWVGWTRRQSFLSESHLKPSIFYLILNENHIQWGKQFIISKPPNDDVMWRSKFLFYNTNRYTAIPVHSKTCFEDGKSKRNARLKEKTT